MIQPKPSSLLLNALLLALLFALATACGGPDADLPDDGTGETDSGPVTSDGGSAQCKASSDCAAVACKCPDGLTIQHQGCKHGVCDTSSVCATVCQGHQAGPDGGSDGGPTTTCDDDFRTGKNAVTGNDVYKACNSNPAKGQAMPTNCASGHFILFDGPQQCFCMLNCDDDFSTPIAPGKACSKDGTYLCRKVKNKSGSVNNLCLPPSWDQALCKAP